MDAWLVAQLEATEQKAESTMKTPLSRHNPDEIHERIVALGDDWADKDAAASVLEETRKSILAKLYLRSPGKSVADREAEAQAHADYEAHVASMIEARRVAVRARVAYDGARMWLDMVRSVEATRRQEMKL